MLQSNTDAGFFKLQPAPRPKSKKRPHNPPPLHNDKSPKTSISDTTSLRSCFEDHDDDELTPKALRSHLPILSAKERVDTEEFSSASNCSPRRSRSSIVSIASATSAHTSSSVRRLLAAMSLNSPRRSTGAVASQSNSDLETLTIVLTNRSPTPSSPIFPRRTLMRSLSSTCINSIAKSPTSPETRSPGAALRKRMGWRGSISERLREETAIIMSPGSPLTPRRADALHTPTQPSISSILDGARLSPCDGEEQMEPLSATLKALGAKRQTQRFPSTCIPVQSPLSGQDSTDGFHMLDGTSEEGGSAFQESFQLMTATRTIFHLPTWIRFEANHHARERVVQENRKAANEFSNLKMACKTSDSNCKQGLVGEMLPKLSRLGDAAPDSPNGELFSGFDINPPPFNAEEADCVVSIVRGAGMATLRASETERCMGGRVLGVVRTALPRFRSDRIKPSHLVEKVNKSKGGLEDERDRRDGWGGVLTRSSWFPCQTKGPLVSPSPIAAKGRGLKKILLQPHTLPSKVAKPSNEWEDIPTPNSDNHPLEPKSFLELNDAPRFYHRSTPTSRTWFLHLSRQRSPAKHDWLNLTNVNKWNVNHTPEKVETVSSKLVTKPKSVENRPLADEKLLSVKVRVAIVAVTAVLIAAIVGNVVILSHANKAHSSTASQLPIAGLPNPPVASNGNVDRDPHNSDVSKAAKLSLP